MRIMNDRTLERASNIAVIAATCAFLIVLLRHEFLPSRTAPTGFNRGTVQLTSITKKPARLDLVLGVSTICPFCEQNVGFYQQLNRMQTPGKLDLLMVFPQPGDQITKYLAKNGLHPEAAVSSSLASYGISGTPTLILGNSPGGVTVQALPQVIRWTFLTAFANL